MDVAGLTFCGGTERIQIKSISDLTATANMYGEFLFLHDSTSGPLESF
jgi:hypothetical protein